MGAREVRIVRRGNAAVLVFTPDQSGPLFELALTEVGLKALALATMQAVGKYRGASPKSGETEVELAHGTLVRPT